MKAILEIELLENMYEYTVSINGIKRAISKTSYKTLKDIMENYPLQPHVPNEEVEEVLELIENSDSAYCPTRKEIDSAKNTVINLQSFTTPNISEEEITSTIKCIGDIVVDHDYFCDVIEYKTLDETKYWDHIKDGLTNLLKELGGNK